MLIMMIIRMMMIHDIVCILCVPSILEEEGLPNWADRAFLTLQRLISGS